MTPAMRPNQNSGQGSLGGLFRVLSDNYHNNSFDNATGKSTLQLNQERAKALGWNNPNYVPPVIPKPVPTEVSQQVTVPDVISKVPTQSQKKVVKTIQSPKAALAAIDTSSYGNAPIAVQPTVEQVLASNPTIPEQPQMSALEQWYKNNINSNYDAQADAIAKQQTLNSILGGGR